MQLEQFSAIALQFSILSSLKIFLDQKIQDQKIMLQIILKERIAHLASYTFSTRDADVDQYENMQLSQLYQLSRTSFFTEQNTYH